MKIYELRKKAGIKQNALATKVGITAAYLCALEREKKNNPNIDLLLSIAKELGVSLETLVGKKVG